jgi:hypothetical protein
MKTLEEALDFMLAVGRTISISTRRILEKRKTTPPNGRICWLFLKALEVDCKLTAPKLP